MPVESLARADKPLVESLPEKGFAKFEVESQVEKEKLLSESSEITKLQAQEVSLLAVVDEPARIQFDPEQIKSTLEQINSVIPIANTRLVFEFDELGDPPIIKVIDKDSNELIREIPSQELLKVAKAFSDMADNLSKAGALVNFRA